MTSAATVYSHMECEQGYLTFEDLGNQFGPFPQGVDTENSDVDGPH